MLRLHAVANSLSKLSLDAIIQRDVAESLRSSAFGRSETFLQLAWVLGAAIALLLPARNGWLGFVVAARGAGRRRCDLMLLHERALQITAGTEPRPGLIGRPRVTSPSDPSSAPAGRRARPGRDGRGC